MDRGWHAPHMMETTRHETERPSATSGATQPRKHMDMPRPEIIVRRPGHQLDPARSKRWLRGGAPTLLLHALSPTFPAGERFFIKTVMAFKDQIDDPRLREEMSRFAAQEAAHTREHLAYDEAVQPHYDVKAIEELCARDLGRTYKFLSRTRLPFFHGPRIALAITVGLEHVTATLAHRVLADERILAGVEPEFARMWSWHAAEEIEHKAVAFDVFQAVGGTWFERAITFAIMQTLLLVDTLRIVRFFLHQDGLKGQWAPWREIADFLFGNPGVLRHAILPLLAFYRPAFHPWDHDDRPLLERWKARYDARLATTPAAG